VPSLFDGCMRCLECYVMNILVGDESKWFGLREIEACSLVPLPQ
jgi:hypothetical protein